MEIASTTAMVLYAVLFAAALLYLSVVVRRGRGAGLPPGPTGLPLVGSLLSLDPDLHTYFAGLAARYGPIFSIRLGSKLGVVITSPALAREVLRDHDLLFSNRDTPDAARSISYGGGQNIVWNPVGPTWRLLRRVCVYEMFSPAGLDNVHGLRRREFRATLRHLHAQAGKSVDVGAQMFLTTMNVVTSALWGSKLGSESERTAVGKEFRDLVAGITEMLGAPNVSDFFPALAPLDLQGIRKKSDLLKDRFNEIFSRIIQQRTKSEQAADGETAVDFLEYMLKLEKEGGDGKASFTMTNVKALLMCDLATGFCGRGDGDDIEHGGVGHGGDAPEPADTAQGAGGAGRGGGAGRRGGGVPPPAAALPAAGAQGDAPAAPGAAADGAALPQRGRDGGRPPHPGGQPRVRQRVGDPEGPVGVEGPGTVHPGAFLAVRRRRWRRRRPEAGLHRQRAGLHAVRVLEEDLRGHPHGGADGGLLAGDAGAGVRLGAAGRRAVGAGRAVRHRDEEGNAAGGRADAEAVQT